MTGIERVAKGVALSFGVPEDRLPVVTRSDESTPPSYNDTGTATRILVAFTEHFGDEMMHSEPREGMGAEDFAYFVQPEHGVKGVYFSVGGPPADQVDDAPSHHSPIFWVEPKPSILSGTEAMVFGAMTLLAE